MTAWVVPRDKKAAPGTRLIHLPTAQMNGHMTRAPSANGREVRVALAIDP